LTQGRWNAFVCKPQQWGEVYRKHKGEDATVYLQINRGGYTVGDWFVAYFLGGYRQYPSRPPRDFISTGAAPSERIPPFLEEGLACMV